MSIESGPHDIDRTRVIFAPSGEATLKTVTPGFYEELAQEFGSFKGHVVIQRFEFDEPWETWEVHPEGDEFRLPVVGRLRVHREDAGRGAAHGAREPARQLRTGAERCLAHGPTARAHLDAVRHAGRRDSEPDGARVAGRPYRGCGPNRRHP